MRIAPRGVHGGGDGARAMIVINPGTENEQRLTRSVTDFLLAPNDVVEVQSAGGGGWGPPRERPPEAIERDLREGKADARLPG